MSVETGIGSRKKPNRRRRKGSVMLAVAMSLTLLTALTQGAPANYTASEPIQQSYESPPTLETGPFRSVAQNSKEKSKKVPDDHISDLVLPYLDGQSFTEHPKQWTSDMSGTKNDQKQTQLYYSQWRRIQRRLQSYSVNYGAAPDNEADFG